MLEVWSYHAIRSTIAITKLLLGCDILTMKKNNTNKKEEKCDFLKLFSLLSGIVIVHKTSLQNTASNLEKQ